MSNTKTTFLPTNKFYMIRKIQSDPVIVHGLTFIMTSNISFSLHSPHIAHVLSTPVLFRLN